MSSSDNNRANSDDLAASRANLSHLAGTVYSEKKESRSGKSVARSGGTFVQRHTCDGIIMKDCITDEITKSTDDVASTAYASSPKKDAKHRGTDEVKHWEEEALSHFRNSDWKDVVRAGKHVLSVPGQVQTNFEVLYEIGYAYMRLGEYEAAAKYFMYAHRIDSNRVSLRLAVRDLRRIIRTGPWKKKRSFDEVSSGDHPGVKNACSPQASPKHAVKSNQDAGMESFDAPNDDQPGFETASTPQG